jgi:potassium-transporting ATPase KdpC subunit
MLRRQLFPAIVLLAILALITGVIYPLVVWGIGQVGFKYRADGSFISHKGQVVGSALIGQNFSDTKGNPLPQYFQPRPSASGAAGYDPSGVTCPPTAASCGASSASNFGPGDPREVGFIPGLNTVDLNGNPSKHNPFATPDDPYCVPTDKQANPVTSPTPGQQYAKNSDGTYVCDANTVPERAATYRQFNQLPDKTLVPVDAVTASNSGLDPDISPANALDQAARVAAARHLPTQTVRALIQAHTNGRQWGFLGEETVNVVDLNLALDSLHRGA